MAQLASGHVAQRPLPHTIYAIAAKRFTGQLTLTQAGRRYHIGWNKGYAVCAESSDPGDTVGRIALTAGFVSSTQLGTALRAHRDQPDRPLVDILAESASLTLEHKQTLLTKAFAQAAVRPFCLHEATFSLTDTITIPVLDTVRPIDPRWLIFHGLRTQYGLDQLRAEMATMAGRKLLVANAADPGIRAFGLDDVSVRIVDALQVEARTLSELRAMNPRSPEATTLALAYALLVTKYATAQGDSSGGLPRVGSVPSVPAVAPPSDPDVLAAKTSSEAPPQRRITTPRASAADPSAIDSARNVINDKLALIDGAADHFAIFGIARGASDDEIRTAYFALARRLHPDRLSAIQLTDMKDEAHRVFARVNQAFAVLSNKTKRAKYIQDLEQGTTAEEERQMEALAQKIFGAEAAFQEGTVELRRGRFADALTAFEKAVELNPDEGEHHALLGWASWCVATDKQAAYKSVKRYFDRAIALSPKCVPAWFYRGQVSKQLDKIDAARECFERVLTLNKTHKEARLELRLLARRAEQDVKTKKGGLLDRFKRR